MGVVATTGATRCAKLQSNHHHQQTNTQLFTGRMPFLSPIIEQLLLLKNQHPVSALTLLVGSQEGHSACKKNLASAILKGYSFRGFWATRSLKMESSPETTRSVKQPCTVQEVAVLLLNIELINNVVYTQEYTTNVHYTHRNTSLMFIIHTGI